MKAFKDFIKEHSLSLVLIAILLVQSADYFFIGYNNWKTQEQVYSKILGEEPKLNYSEYFSTYRAEMMVSLLADTYGAILLVILTKHLKEQGSAESKGK